MRAFLLAILLLVPATLHAERLPLKSYTVADGLPNNVINKIVRDSRGFLWFWMRRSPEATELSMGHSAETSEYRVCSAAGVTDETSGYEARLKELVMKNLIGFTIATLLVLSAGNVTAQKRRGANKGCARISKQKEQPS